MDISSADFMKLSLQEVADMLLDQEKHVALCQGMVEGKLCNVYVKLELVE